MTLPLLFLPLITLALYSHLLVHMNPIFSCHVKNVIEILVKFVMNLKVTFKL